MKVSYKWLQDYVQGKLPGPKKLAEALTMHSFETEGPEKVRNDYVFDIDILANRAHDCLGHLGIARECAVLFNRKIKLPKTKPRESRTITTEDFVEVKIKNTELCPRYCARVITGIKVGPSPKWLKERLEAIGQKSINNIVDITNYVMFETGQPLHAFDADKLTSTKKKKQIIVRQAKKGEAIVTLDEEKYELDSSVLVIADNRDPIAIAGIKGGKKAEIDNKTKTIILESANFEPTNIFKTSKKLGLQTEASLRFRYGLDPNLAPEAIDRAANLIQKIAGGQATKGIVDIYPFKIKPWKISLKIDKVRSVLGVDVSEKEVVRILKSLGMASKIVSPRREIVNLAKKLIGKPYKYGASTSQEAPNLFDCSSFTRYLFRQIGIEIPRMSIEQIKVGDKVEKEELKPGDLVFSKGIGTPHRDKDFPQGVGHVALYIGNNKIIHASKKKKKVVVEDLARHLRSSQWRGARRIIKEEDNILVVDIPTRRLDLKIPEDLIEEIGRIYGYEKIVSNPPFGLLSLPRIRDEIKIKDKIKSILEGLGLTEVYNYSFVGENDIKKCKLNSEKYIELENPLSIEFKYLRRSLITNLLKNTRENLKYFERFKLFEIGKIYLKTKNKLEEKEMLSGILIGKNAQELFFESKGLIDLLLNKLGITDQWYDDFQASPEWTEEVFWDKERSAEIKLGNEEIGFLGVINPEILTAFEIKKPVVAFEINLGLLIKAVEEELIYQPPSKYPAVIRDISLLVNIDDKVADVLNIINTVGGKIIKDVDLFDIYEGEEIPQGKKSFAFHIIYQAEDRTLTDQEVDAVHKKIVQELEKNPEWQVRK